MNSYKKLWKAGMPSCLLLAMGLVSCSENEELGNVVGPEESNLGKYVFATTVQGSNGSSYVLLTGDSLDEGELTTENNGLRNDGATQWIIRKDYLYALTYNQGNASTTRSYFLGDDGEMVARGTEYKISRFTSFGGFDNDIITMSTGAGAEKFADENGYTPKTLLVTYLDIENETSRSNDTSTGLYSLENYLGNGEYVTLAGAEQSGDKIYSGMVPMGLSQYGVSFENGKWVLPGNEHLVHTEAGGSGSGSYKAGELVGTQYPNECWVAVYDNEDFLNPKLVRTDRISYPCGRNRSQYYQTVWRAESGDIYVFSSSYAKTMTDDAQKTALPAGVCRIPAGSTSFDDYYCNIEAQTTDGNRSFMRCWPAGGNNFLLMMYDGPLGVGKPSATELAVFNADQKKLSYVSGLPSGITSLGRNVYAEGGKVYIPVNVENEYPAIYAIDTATAKAVKGVTIRATEISGFGYLKHNVK